MKFIAMKSSSLLISSFGILALTAFNSSCQRSNAAIAKTEERAPENGAQFKRGEGLSLTDEMRTSIGLKVEDVAEEKVGSSVKLSLAASDTHTATGWISPAQAVMIHPGIEVRMHSSSAALKGTVDRIEPAPFVSGDAEIIVTSEDPLTPGTALTAILENSAGDAVPAIPSSALLKTAEGTFVYTVNGKFFVRTPVIIGAVNDRHVEIKDGLYAGDQIVTTPVMSLWMAELQVLRGGKACTCGH